MVWEGNSLAVSHQLFWMLHCREGVQDEKRAQGKFCQILALIEELEREALRKVPEKVHFFINFGVCFGVRR